MTTLPPEKAPAEDGLAAVYAERLEIEGAFDELKTHLRGSCVVLRAASCPPRQPFPSRQKERLFQAILQEILEQRVQSSRGRSIPRVVRRKNARLRDSCEKRKTPKIRLEDRCVAES